MFGINLSDLSWQVWILCAVGAGIIALIAHTTASDASQRKGGGGGFASLVAWLFTFTAALCAIMTIIVFIKQG